MVSWFSRWNVALVQGGAYTLSALSRGQALQVNP